MTLATEEWIERADAPKLFVRSWSPADEARALLVIVPGFNLHSGYYAWARMDLRRRE